MRAGGGALGVAAACDPEVLDGEEATGREQNATAQTVTTTHSAVDAASEPRALQNSWHGGVYRGPAGPKVPNFLLNGRCDRAEATRRSFTLAPPDSRT